MADQGGQWDERGRAAALVGFAGGAVGFVGFFLNFFSQGGSSLSSASLGWFDLVPIFLGLSALALFLPKYKFLFSGLSLISLGLAFGIRSGITSVNIPNVPHGIFGYGTGFWMITIGSGVLAMAWWVVLANDLRSKA